MGPNLSRRGTALAMLASLAPAACAAQLALQPASLQPPTAPAAQRSVSEVAVGRSSAGYLREIPAGTRVELVGRIAEGEVWRPLNHTLTAEGASVHEAYIVANGGRWVGFYLPVERAYSPLQTSVNLEVR